MRDSGSCRCLAVVGMAKHAGKTTALNRLVEQARRRGASVGLCSIGLDGESTDAIHDLDKPPVYCSSGQLIATLREPLAASTCEVESLDILSGETPLGRLHLARCVTAGRAILAGIRTSSQLERVVRVMSDRGAKRVFVDGAFGRSMAAGASTTDALVLAAGAVGQPSPQGVAQAAGPVIDQLQRPAASSGWQSELLARAEADKAVTLGGPGVEPRRLEASSALVALRQSSDAWGDDLRAIAVPGAVTDSVADALLNAPILRRLEHRPWLLVPDVSSFHLGPESWRALRDAWRVVLGRSIPLKAVAINPRRPDGTSLDPDALRRAFKRWMVDHNIDPLPVWDPRTANRVAGV